MWPYVYRKLCAQRDFMYLRCYAYTPGAASISMETRDSYSLLALFKPARRQLETSGTRFWQDRGSLTSAACSLVKPQGWIMYGLLVFLIFLYPAPPLLLLLLLWSSPVKSSNSNVSSCSEARGGFWGADYTVFTLALAAGGRRDGPFASGETRWKKNNIYKGVLVYLFIKESPLVGESSDL